MMSAQGPARASLGQCGRIERPAGGIRATQPILATTTLGPRLSLSDPTSISRAGVIHVQHISDTCHFPSPMASRLEIDWLNGNPHSKKRELDIYVWKYIPHYQKCMTLDRMLVSGFHPPPSLKTAHPPLVSRSRETPQRFYLAVQYGRTMTIGIELSFPAIIPDQMFLKSTISAFFQVQISLLI